MTELALSRRAVTRALVTLPIIAVPAVAAATPRGADTGDVTMNMQTRIENATSEWQMVRAEYQAARHALDLAFEQYSKATDSAPAFPEPAPVAPEITYPKDILDITIGEIKACGYQPGAWETYEAAQAEWQKARDTWNKRHETVAGARYGEAYDRLIETIAAMAACRVCSAVEMADKLETGVTIFNQDGPVDREDEIFTTFFESVRDDAASLAKAA